MNRISRSAIVGVSALLAFATVGDALAQKPASAKQAAPAKVGYASAEKVLKARCVGCHNGPNGQAGVNLANYQSVVGGKWKGKPLVVPKKPNASVLVNAVHGHGMMKMPPGAMLPAGELKTLEAWIASGAKK